MASSVESGAIYGIGVYGTAEYGVTSTAISVDGTSATGAVGSVSISAGSTTELSAFVSAEIITDAPGVIGDEVTIVGDANLELTSVEGTGEVTTVSQRTVNRVPVTGVSATGSVETVVVVAEAVVDLPSVEATGQAGDGFNFQSIYFPTGVEGTGAVTTVVVGNNAIPTLTGVQATGIARSPVVTTTTVIFNVANKDHERTALVSPDKPRIVYVRAA